MKTLKELVQYQDITGISDIEVIIMYFKENDIEEQGMILSYELAKDKIDKMKKYQHFVREWNVSPFSKELYKKYDLDTADNLLSLKLDFIANNQKLSDTWFKWAKENIPNIENPIPQIPYFIPLIEWLEKQGIKFKERNE